MSNSPLLDEVASLVRRVAHSEVMPRFLRVGSSRKEDGSQFTEADIEAQHALVAGLPALVPCPVLGEEMSDCEHLRLWRENDTLWVIDPIDGTTNFINGIPYFAISVALVKQGRPVLGVIYNPVSDELFHAELGKGAFLNGQPLPRKQVIPEMADAVAGVEIKWLFGHLPTRLATLSPFGSQRNFGASTLDWCYLAAGRLDLYVHGGQRLWDYAAGCLIMAEAGGSMASLHHDDYWADDVWKRSVIAAGDPHLFKQWQQWIKANL